MKKLIKFASVLTLSLIATTSVYAHSDCGTEEAHEHSTTDAAPVTVGDLSLTDARSRAMLAAQKVGGGYVTIKNNGKSDDRLVSVSSDRAERMEVHEMAMEGDVMKMRKLEDGLTIAAGESVELKPGGNHLMFFGVDKPFAEGEKITVEFLFEKAGKVKVELLTTPAASAKTQKHH